MKGGCACISEPKVVLLLPKKLCKPLNLNGFEQTAAVHSLYRLFTHDISGI